MEMNLVFFSEGTVPGIKYLALVILCSTKMMLLSLQVGVDFYKKE